MQRSHPQKLAIVLDQIIDSANMRSRMAERRAIALWPAVVGEALAMRAIAIEAKNGALLIRCDKPVIRQEIMLGRKPILDKLNELAGAIVLRDIIFV